MFVSSAVLQIPALVFLCGKTVTQVVTVSLEMPARLSFFRSIANFKLE